MDFLRTKFAANYPIIGLIVCIVLVSLGLRLYIAAHHPEAHDEDDYLAAARRYREYLDAGNWSGIIDETYNTEHPPLVKLLFAPALDEHELQAIPREVPRSSRSPLPPHSLHNTRMQSVAAGTLTVLVTALGNPAAAAMLSVQSIHMRFSSLAYLDALPTLFITLAALFYTKGKNFSGQAHIKQTAPNFIARFYTKEKRFLWLSALCLGLAVAAKYPFAIAGFAMLGHAFTYRIYPLKWMLGWGILAILVFFLFNPFLWHSPFERLHGQLTYHQEYAGNQVPTHTLYKPIVQLITPNNHLPPQVHSPIWVITDSLIFLLMLPGVVILVRDKSVYGWWLILGMLFLMIYPSQWIQHKMLIVVPYSMSAAAGLQWLWNRAITPRHLLRKG